MRYTIQDSRGNVYGARLDRDAACVEALSLAIEHDSEYYVMAGDEIAAIVQPSDAEDDQEIRNASWGLA